MDELLAIVAYTDEAFYWPLNHALRTDRTNETCDVKWNARGPHGSKQAFLPYLYLLYSALSKLPRAPHPMFYRGMKNFTNMEAVMQPHLVLGQHQPIAQINSFSSSLATGEDFSTLQHAICVLLRSYGTTELNEADSLSRAITSDTEM